MNGNKNPEGRRMPGGRSARYELPAGRLVLSLSGHFAAMIGGVLHDTHDCSRDGTRCVYGYWVAPTHGGG